MIVFIDRVSFFVQRDGVQELLLKENMSSKIRKTRDKEKKMDLEKTMIFIRLTERERSGRNFSFVMW